MHKQIKAEDINHIMSNTRSHIHPALFEEFWTTYSSRI